MIIAIVALLSLFTGLAVVAVIQLGIVAFHLSDLKAYTMTEVTVLRQITRNQMEE